MKTEPFPGPLTDFMELRSEVRALEAANRDLKAQLEDAKSQLRAAGRELGLQDVRIGELHRRVDELVEVAADAQGTILSQRGQFLAVQDRLREFERGASPAPKVKFPSGDQEPIEHGQLSSRRAGGLEDSVRIEKIISHQLRIEWDWHGGRHRCRAVNNKAVGRWCDTPREAIDTSWG
jgi:hypothetical protein